MKKKPSTYLLAGCQPWSREVFERDLCRLPGKWHFIAAPGDLTREKIAALNPAALFFLHWFWKVPAEIVNAYECICFHPTDLPYGRGGSPIQNLILRGHTTTVNTAFKMTAEMDAGPVYLKEPLSLEGSAEEIYRRFAALSARMIQKIIVEKPRPVPQSGEVVTFKRRRPEESRIPQNLFPQALYDFIRMLDAPGYPKAFLEAQGVRMEFEKAQRRDQTVTARVALIRP